MVMDQLSEEVRQEPPWTMMFADDIVICSESREQVEENLERWRFALERRGMKVSRSKTEYMCVNEREGSGPVRLQGEEVKKVQEFKYLGSTVQNDGECGKEQSSSIHFYFCGWRPTSDSQAGVRGNMQQMGLHVKFPAETLILADFKRYLVQQEVNNVSRMLKYILSDSNVFIMDLLTRGTETKDYLSQLKNAKLVS
ncbi:hypothetical protein QTP86_020190 [Hemibagrus guttatus]|nr:hypothetical protein QTP86_020190 [Hemibagrus guttatus]